jgi:hypothetical protein
MMLQPMSKVSIQNVQWLRGLRWVDRAELAWLIVLPAALAVWLLTLYPQLGWPVIALPGGSHLALALCAVACAPRGKTHIYCGLVLISALHFLVFSAMEYARLLELGWAYVTLACCIAAGCGVLQLCHAARFRATLSAAQREGYRWLLTQAPLPWRLKFVRALARGAD